MCYVTSSSSIDAARMWEWRRHFVAHSPTAHGAESARESSHVRVEEDCNIVWEIRVIFDLKECTCYFEKIYIIHAPVACRYSLKFTSDKSDER